jgi:uncharacterized protein (DUF4213/DUF364 family)
LQVIPALEQAKKKFVNIVDKHQLMGELVKVTIGTLSPQQAIGSPARQDFALLAGKEVMIEAQFRESYGQAFTSQPQNFTGLIDDVLSLNLNTADHRAIFVATLNAVASHLGITKEVRHCRDEEPEKCGSQIAQNIADRYGKIKIVQVGYQPAILENLIKRFGAANVQCTDLDPRNIGTDKFGVTICDGASENMNLIKWCDLMLVTSSTNVNNTFDELYEATIAKRKHFVMFGVTGAGIAALLNLDRICPLGH